MKLRLFVAINLPEYLKKQIDAEISQIEPLFSRPLRFLKPGNWHLTISFLGYEDAGALSPILAALKNTAEKTPSPIVELASLDYGPSESLSQPARMIWLKGTETTSKKLGDLKKTLEANLAENQVNFKMENRAFHAHLTLARFGAVPRRNLPPLGRECRSKFEARTLDLMQSHLKRSGAEYELLSSFDFKKTL